MTEKTVTLDLDLWEAIKRLLRYSFTDIAYRYEHLTTGPNGEQSCITREQFERLKVLLGQ